jgi:hypothetical protein
MRDFEHEGPRAEGPAVVWTGPEDTPALVVIDPSGAAKHEDLPASWHALAAIRQVAWCRLPASRHPVEDIEDVLETLADRQTRVDVVAAGDACATAVTIGTQFAAAVRSILLVDPPGVAAQADPRDTTGGEPPPPVRVVVRSAGGARDRVEAPVPLGHPDVVAAVAGAIAEMDQVDANAAAQSIVD